MLKEIEHLQARRVHPDLIGLYACTAIIMFGGSLSSIICAIIGLFVPADLLVTQPKKEPFALF